MEKTEFFPSIPKTSNGAKPLLTAGGFLNLAINFFQVSNFRKVDSASSSVFQCKVFFNVFRIISSKSLVKFIKMNFRKVFQRFEFQHKVQYVFQLSNRVLSTVFLSKVAGFLSAFSSSADYKQNFQLSKKFEK